MLIKKLKRNLSDQTSIVFFLYKIKHRVFSIYWRNFNKTVTSRINNSIKIKFSNEVFIININDIKSSINKDEFLFLSPNDSASIIELANRHFKDYYQLLGSKNTYLNPINWHLDFKSGFVWKKNVFYQDYIQESIAGNSDVKVPRELSRCHHLLNMAVAYKIKNESKYAIKIIDQINNWIDENPLMYSINWGCTMDVAIRASNWIWALNLTSEVWQSNVDFVKKVKLSLYQHGWFIFRNLEKEQVNNHNHYLADIAGQIHLGLVFKDTKEGAKWLHEGIKELFKEIRYQILPSGMSYERSTNYNRLVLELIVGSISVLRNNGFEIPQDIWFRMEKMFEFLIYTIKPDGRSPVIGDQDNGRFLPFGVEAQIDYTYLFALGATLFDNPKLKYFSKTFNIYSLMLAGDDAFKKYSIIECKKVELESKRFPDVGFYIFRKGNNYLLFNCAGKGMNPEINKNSGTHTHSDLLSFELVSNGKTFLVDPGSFVYTADANERFLYRSTCMHNTVTIDRMSQDNLRLQELWGFERNAIPTVEICKFDEKLDKIIASHNGYERLNNPVKHIRELNFFKDQIKWEIIDSFSGVQGEHLYEWYFHFDTGIDFEICENKVKTVCTDNNNIELKFETTQPILFSKISSFVSKSYGLKEPSRSLKLEFKGDVFPKLNVIINPI